MIIKTKWILLAFWKESVKRIPYVIALLVILGAFGFYKSYRKTAEGVDIAKQNTTEIKQIVDSQTNILNAIQKVTTDNNLTAKQQTDIIICMLQVPVEQRTTDLKESCRKQVENQSSTTPGSQNNSQNFTSRPQNTNSNTNGSTSNNQQPKQGGGGTPPGGVTPKSFVSKTINNVEGLGRWLGGKLGL